MKKIECEGVGDNDGFFELEVKASPKERIVMCDCHACIKEFDLRSSFLPDLLLSSERYILCPDCGNKRCPKASDHRLKCTNSNETGQTGSIYT